MTSNDGKRGGKGTNKRQPDAGEDVKKGCKLWKKSFFWNIAQNKSNSFSFQQVDQLKKQNNEKERLIQELSKECDRLNSMLSHQQPAINFCVKREEHHQQMIGGGRSSINLNARGGGTTTTSSSIPTNSMANLAVGGIGISAATPSMNTRKRQLLQVPPFKMEIVTNNPTNCQQSSSSTSPSSPPTSNDESAVTRFSSSDGNMGTNQSTVLMNGMDPGEYDNL
jgi:hypothetical protein